MDYSKNKYLESKKKYLKIKYSCSGGGNLKIVDNQTIIYDNITFKKTQNHGEHNCGIYIASEQKLLIKCTKENSEKRNVLKFKDPKYSLIFPEIKGVYDVNDVCYIVMEYLENGTVEDYIINKYIPEKLDQDQLNLFNSLIALNNLSNTEEEQKQILTNINENIKRCTISDLMEKIRKFEQEILKFYFNIDLKITEKRRKLFDDKILFYDFGYQNIGIYKIDGNIDVNVDVNVDVKFIDFGSFRYIEGKHIYFHYRSVFSEKFIHQIIRPGFLESTFNPSQLSFLKKTTLIIFKNNENLYNNLKINEVAMNGMKIVREIYDIFDKIYRMILNKHFYEENKSYVEDMPMLESEFVAPEIFESKITDLQGDMINEIEKMHTYFNNDNKSAIEKILETIQNDIATFTEQTGNVNIKCYELMRIIIEPIVQNLHSLQ